MIYYCYEMRWNQFDSFDESDHEVNEFEKRYEKMTLVSMNKDFFNAFLTNKNFLILVTERKKYDMQVLVAANVQSLCAISLDEQIKEKFQECLIVSKREITINDYKKFLSDIVSAAVSESTLLDHLNIGYRDTFFDPLPFSVEEQIMGCMEMEKGQCLKRAKEILASESLYEELDRIYSDENAKRYYGHPVHYMISACDWSAGKDIYELLLNALAYNNRLISERLMVFKNIKKDSSWDERFKQMIRAAEGGTVIIELKCEASKERYATEFHELAKTIGDLLEERKRDTLFIFVEVLNGTLKDREVLNHIITKADIIQLNEGRGPLEEAKKYLLKMATNVEFDVKDVSDVIHYLPEQEYYTVSDIFSAYNAWYGCGLKSHVYKAYREKETFKVPIKKKKGKAYETLQNMIGLTEVKNIVEQIIATSKVLRLRETMNLKVDDMSLHMLFSGNPGTAKTTVARLLTEILKDEGAIKTGKFIECGRQDLVGKYVGWTAKIVEEKFKQAMGGILFIDEAYALIDESNSYGMEAINTITQMMENYRNDVIVIFAGYPKRMEEFLAQNEGLRSRIAFHLNFLDYSAEELFGILQLLAKEREYHIEASALQYCETLFDRLKKDENSGNGRLARNILEQAILRQALRITSVSEERMLSKKEVCCLRQEDFSMPVIYESKKVTRIGFCS